jgi:hypothetical protein
MPGRQKRWRRTSRAWSLRSPWCGRGLNGPSGRCLDSGKHTNATSSAGGRDPAPRCRRIQRGSSRPKANSMSSLVPHRRSRPGRPAWRKWSAPLLRSMSRDVLVSKRPWPSTQGRAAPVSDARLLPAVIGATSALSLLGPRPRRARLRNKVSSRWSLPTTAPTGRVGTQRGLSPCVGGANRKNRGERLRPGPRDCPDPPMSGLLFSRLLRDRKRIWVSGGLERAGVISCDSMKDRGQVRESVLRRSGSSRVPVHTEKVGVSSLRLPRCWGRDKRQVIRSRRGTSLRALRAEATREAERSPISGRAHQ